MPSGGEPSDEENAALAAALLGHVKRSGPDDFASLTSFLEQHPKTVWQPALLTLAGTGSVLNRARWSADGDVILAGSRLLVLGTEVGPWQAWSAPSWEEIKAAEAKEKMEIKQP